MTFLVERLAELGRHLDHLRAIRPRVTGRAALEQDLSLHNDVLLSLLMIAQLVIDIAGELSARRRDRFEEGRDVGGVIDGDRTVGREDADIVAEVEREAQPRKGDLERAGRRNQQSEAPAERARRGAIPSCGRPTAAGSSRSKLAPRGFAA
jgi:hypothetical protein